MEVTPDSPALHSATQPYIATNKLIVNYNNYKISKLINNPNNYSPLANNNLKSLIYTNNLILNYLKYPIFKLLTIPRYLSTISLATTNAILNLNT